MLWLCFAIVAVLILIIAGVVGTIEEHPITRVLCFGAIMAALVMLVLSCAGFFF